MFNIATRESLFILIAHLMAYNIFKRFVYTLFIISFLV